MLLTSLLLVALGATPPRPALVAPTAPLTIVQNLGPAPLVLQGGIAALAFSADRRHLIGLSRYGRLISWELAHHQVEWLGGNTLGGDRRNTLLPLAKGGVLVLGDGQRPMAFDPTTDHATALGDGSECRGAECQTRGIGALLPPGYVVAEEAGALKLWSVDRPEPPRRISVGDPDRAITAIALHAADRTVAVGAADGKLQLWDIDSGAMKWESAAHDGDVASVSFTSDGHHLVTVGVDGWARLWTAKTGEQRSQFRLESDRIAGPPVVEAVSSDDGRYALLTRGAPEGPRSFELWDLQKRKRRWQRPSAPGAVAAFFPDGTQLAVSTLPAGLPWLDELDTVLLLETSTGKPLLEPAAHVGQVRGLTFLPSGEVLSSGADGLVSAWDPTSGTRLATWKGHRGGVDGVVSWLGGALALSTGDDGSARLWRVKTGTQIGTWVDAEGRPPVVAEANSGVSNSETSVRTLAVSGDGARALLQSRDRVGLFDVRSGHPIEWLQCTDTSQPPLAGFGASTVIGVCPVGRTALALRRWDLQGKPLSASELASTYGAQAMAISNAGFALLAADVDTGHGPQHTILRWDLATDVVRPVFNRHQRPVTALALIDDFRAVSASWDGSVKIWSVETGEESASLDLWRSGGDIPRALAVSPDKKSLLVGTERGAILRAQVPASDASLEGN